MNPWLPLWLASCAAGFVADGSTEFAREVTTRDRRVYVHAVTWGGEAPVPFWCSGLHHSEGRCFAGTVPVLREMPPVVTPVLTDRALRHLAFRGTVVAKGDEWWIATGCEQPGSANAICVQRIAGGTAEEPARFLPAPEATWDVDRVRLEGEVVFSRYGGEVYAQRGAEAPQRILENVVDFDADGLRVAYSDGHSVRLLELNENLDTMRDTQISEARGAQKVTIDGPSIAWISDGTVSVAKGARAEDLRAEGGWVVWSERVGDEVVLHAWRDGVCVIAGRTTFDDPFFFDVVRRGDGRVAVIWRDGPSRLAWRVLEHTVRTGGTP